MANEAREIVGEVECPYCLQRSLVKKNVKGKLYFSCTEHGINHMNTPSGQDWILNNMKSRGAGDAPVVVEAPAPVADESVEPMDTPAPVVEPVPVVVVPAQAPVVVVKPAAPARRAPVRKPRPAAPAKRDWMSEL